MLYAPLELSWTDRFDGLLIARSPLWSTMMAVDRAFLCDYRRYRLRQQQERRHVFVSDTRAPHLRVF